MTTGARNENPLHTHTSPGEIRLRWTQDTLSAHLERLHGAELPLDRSLPNLLALHDALNHGTPAEDPAFTEALTPERRYKSITLGEPRMGRPGDVALHFEDLNGNGTNIVNLRPGDMPALRAAVLPESGGLKALQDIWSANLGPGGRRAVEAGHAAGYKLGVDDMENTPAYRTGPVETAEVTDWLHGLYASGAADGNAEDADALRRVLGFLQQRLDEQKEASHG